MRTGDNLGHHSDSDVRDLSKLTGHTFDLVQLPQGVDVDGHYPVQNGIFYLLVCFGNAIEDYLIWLESDLPRFEELAAGVDFYIAARAENSRQDRHIGIGLGGIAKLYARMDRFGGLPEASGVLDYAPLREHIEWSAILNGEPECVNAVDKQVLATGVQVRRLAVLIVHSSPFFGCRFQVEGWLESNILID